MALKVQRLKELRKLEEELGIKFKNIEAKDMPKIKPAVL